MMMIVWFLRQTLIKIACFLFFVVIAILRKIMFQTDLLKNVCFISNSKSRLVDGIL